MIRFDLGLNDWGKPRGRHIGSRLEIVEDRMVSARSRHLRYLIPVMALFLYASATTYLRFVQPPIEPFSPVSDSIRLSIVVLAPFAIYILSRPLFLRAATTRAWLFEREGLSIEYRLGESVGANCVSVTIPYKKVKIVRAVCEIETESERCQSSLGRAIHGAVSYRICVPGYHEAVFISDDYWSGVITSILEPLTDDSQWHLMRERDACSLAVAKSHYLSSGPAAGSNA